MIEVKNIYKKFEDKEVLRDISFKVNKIPTIISASAVTTVYNGGKYLIVTLKDQNGNTIIYTLRIFNEGNIAGYAQEVKDNLPEGITFLPEHPINKQYGWIKEKDGSITTDYLARGKGDEVANDGVNLIHAFDKNNGYSDSINDKNPDYKEISVSQDTGSACIPLSFNI